MIKHTRPLVLVASTALTLFALTACGGGNSSKSAADSQLSAIKSAEALASSIPTDGSSDSPSQLSSEALSSLMNMATAGASSPSVPDEDASNIDVCALLSQADAGAVATADKLDGAQTATTVYKLTATKEQPGAADRSACRFDLGDSGAEGTMLIEVGPGSMIDLFNVGGTKVDGLGDEAYSGVGGGTVVRVGGLMMNVGDDSFTEDFTIDLLRKMAPNLK